MDDNDYKYKLNTINKSIERPQRMLKQIAKAGTPVTNLNLNYSISKQIDNLQKQLEKCYEPIRQYQNIISHSFPDLFRVDSN